MKAHRKLLTVSLSLIAAALMVFLVLRWTSRPPQAVRLLPEGEFLAYGNLTLLHLFDSKKSNPVHPDPEYQSFIGQTDIRFERDVDEVAISMHNPGAEAESSSIFIGHFDPNKLRNYLQTLAATSEKYADKTIFSIVHDGRTVRVCILSDDQVAVTNMGSAEPIHSMVDKFRSTKLAAHGPYLAEQYYPYVPFRSTAWLIYRVPSQPGATQLPEGLSFDFLQNTTGVISLRLPFWFSGPLKLKAEVFANSEAEATDVAESAHNFLSLYRSIAQSVGSRGTDRDVRKAFDSIQVEQKENRAIFTATIPQSFLKKIASEAQPGNQSPPEPTPGKRP